MGIGDFLGRIGDNIGNAPPEAWFSLAQALSSSRDPLQGLAQGAAGFGQQIQETRKKRSLADALQGAMGGMSPQQQAFAKAVMQSDPSQAVGLIGQQLFTKPADKPNDIREYEFAKSQGFNGTFMDYQTALRKSGASSVNVNNIPAEVGARIALGEGFLGQIDDIKERAKKFYGSPSMTEQVKRRGQMIFNTGEGGKIWREVEVGKEALVRQLTGAGMAVPEAEAQAARYSLSPYDTEFDAITKLDGLARDLNNTARGAYSAKGGKYTPPKGASSVIKYDANGNRIQ